jgi:hypothetical protein
MPCPWESPPVSDLKATPQTTQSPARLSKLWRDFSVTPAQGHIGFLFFLFVAPQFELRALHLLGSALSLELHPQPFFALSIFQIGFHVYAWVGLDCNPPLYASRLARMTDMHHHAQLIG